MAFLTYKKIGKWGRVRTLVFAVIIVITFVVLFAVPWTEKVVGFARVAPKVQWSLVQPEPGSFQASLKRGDRVEIQKFHFRETSNSDHLDFELSECCIEGKTIQAGETIAVIGSWTMNSEFQNLQNERDVAEANLALLKAGSRPEDIAVEQKQLDIAGQNFSAYAAEHERTCALHDSGYVSDAEYEIAVNNHALLEKELELARSRVAAATAGESYERIRVEEKNIEKLNRQIDALQECIDRDEIKTPISGVVIKPESASVFCTIAQLDEMTIRILIREQDLLYVHPGGKFVVRSFALPHERFYGEIEYLQTSPEILNNRSYFVAIGHVENADGILMPGMLGAAKIYGREVSIFQYIYERIRHTIFVQFGI